MKKIFVFFVVAVLLASWGGKLKYDAQVSKVDSLENVCKKLTEINTAMRAELDGYKYSPAKLLASIRENYADKEYKKLEKNLNLLHKYHPDAQEYKTANGIYEQGLKDQEMARKKAKAEAAKREAERQAKMKPVERIMKKYSCDELTAWYIQRGSVKLGMTRDQCRAAWGRPSDINRTVGSFGVHEQWCYNGSYLYFEDGILTTIQN